MKTEISNKKNLLEKFHGPNLGYVMEQYERYKEDPSAVDGELKEFFHTWELESISTDVIEKAFEDFRETPLENEEMLNKVIQSVKLADNIRAYGHLSAKIYSLEKQKGSNLLDLDHYGLSEEDLKVIPAKTIWPDAPGHIQTGLDAVKALNKMYTQSLAYEFSHIQNEDERKWLTSMIESELVNQRMSTEQRIALLEKLTAVEGLEKFLHRTFVGQKRFSIEGVDMLIPMLDEIIRNGVQNGVRNVMIGMAHRGRLNVLAHVLNKPYEMIFSEFHHAPNKELVPSEGSRGINYGWTGDVKYHLGANREIGESNIIRARLTLANNPSHLEYINPVVQGYARVAQEDCAAAGFPKQDVQKSFSILIHGDAAFPGEGIVAETLNLGQLSGYQTGGSIHIIANNRIGFTTDSYDSRSTRYASDLAKGYEIPIVHVNADDPEACIAAMKLAYEYRRRFNKDFLVDLIGYRRFGHNEMDDPFVTQPEVYEKVKNHPTVRALYADTLKSEGLIKLEEINRIEQAIQDKLQAEYDKVKSRFQEGEIEEVQVPEEVMNGLPHIETAVPIEMLRDINNALLKFPEEFHVYPKLKKILQRRTDMLDEKGKIDWGLAETLAFSSILSDGTPIRITGQDSERGTFSQRHIVLTNSKTGEKYSPLHLIPQAKASFAVHNSPLSEAAVLGFEYGYNVYDPQTLVLWEAQYGDFANAAQVIFDQFISAGRAKWGQKSGLVVLLPHGYEGQGPEHSSGRLERFLTLAAESNWTIANLTSAAQYFHILRRQAKILDKTEVRPLVIMTPKSLLRNSYVSSPSSMFSEGSFQTVIEQPRLGENIGHVKRIVLCSGKIAIDLEAELQLNERIFDWLHIIRVEQLYPFPKEKLKEIFARYSNIEEVVWLQEEPKNMGAWTYMESKMKEIVPEHVMVRYIGRVERSSPAGGEPNVHKKEQERIVKEAFKPLKETLKVLN
ncbi:2-oxoglutarate dehydrogenase E1 component [Bacillus taeanensis]|uniref:2-oxoglutarate dehydrogenase E1 component n=1 Tax=Bacillus taeanensis TaxID=273032 RepID=A0A366XQ98_9BACI|nr:2-oxoglutarate dehydrogenase E1 component [Bacillus taeanensis]RBW67275.1 2-oxoglutarate dehydrogenase E1 component [Bacillus taeanensis]